MPHPNPHPNQHFEGTTTSQYVLTNVHADTEVPPYMYKNTHSLVFFW